MKREVGGVRREEIGGMGTRNNRREVTQEKRQEAECRRQNA